MTPEELAMIERWQTTDGGRAEIALHGLSITVDDLENAACTRDGFSTIRKCRSTLIKARNDLDKLITSTAILQAAE